MARAIVPSNRNSGIPCPELDHPPADPFSDINDVPFAPEPIDDLDALVIELQEAEGLCPVEALSQALALQDFLYAFAVIWDADAALAGNPTTACPVCASDPVPVIAPQLQLVAG